MAKSADDIERELEIRRQQLHARVNRLRTRVAGDVRDMRTQTGDELASYKSKAEEHASEHPLLTLAGGLGAGIALGVAMPSAPTSKNHSQSSKDSSNGHSEGPEGLLSKGFGAVLNATGGPVFHEVRTSLRDSLDGIRTSLQDSVSDVVHSVVGSRAAEKATNAAPSATSGSSGSIDVP